RGGDGVDLPPGRDGSASEPPVVPAAVPVRHHSRQPGAGLDRQPAHPARGRRGDDRRCLAAARPPGQAADHGAGMTAFTATAAYEWRMQLRKPAIWIATALPYLVYVGFALLGTDTTGLSRYRQETDPKVWMVDALGWFAPFLPMVFGIVLADRLVRD